MCPDEFGCAVRPIPLVDGHSTRPHRAALRASCCHRQGQPGRPRLLALPMRLRHRDDSVRWELAGQADRELWLPQCRDHRQSEPRPRRRCARTPHIGVPDMGGDAVTLQQPERRELRTLRRARHHRVSSVVIVRELPRRHGPAASGWLLARAHRQRPRLRARQLPVGGPNRPGEQSPVEPVAYARWPDEDYCGMGAARWHRSIDHRQAARSKLVGVSSADDASAGEVSTSLNEVS